MEVIRNLLVYCLQVKEEGDAAGMLLSTVNLDQLKKLINSTYYNSALREYKKVVAKNNEYNDKHFPEYAKYRRK